MSDLTDRLPGTDDPDALYEAFEQWVTERGITLYPAQEEALIEVVSGANVVLSTPTGSGKSLVAIGAHFAALARGETSWDTACLKMQRVRWPQRATVAWTWYMCAWAFGPIIWMP